jgi:hypothetical protein
MEEQDVRINWKVNDRIRNKETGKPFLVLHVSKYYCQLVDLEDKQPLVQPLILLQRNFADYAKDQDMELVKKKSSIMEWEFHPVYL